MTLERKDYLALVEQAHTSTVLDFFAIGKDASLVLEYSGYIQPKERPRFTRGGRAYTSEKTVAFEKSFKNAISEQLPKDFALYTYPIRLGVLILDERPPRDYIERHDSAFYFSGRGDVDNKGKSIQDAMNKVVFDDDKRIVDLRIRREFADAHGCVVTITRAGLNFAEYNNFVKYRKAHRAK